MGFALKYYVRIILWKMTFRYWHYIMGFGWECYSSSFIRIYVKHDMICIFDVMAMSK